MSSSRVHSNPAAFCRNVADDLKARPKSRKGRVGQAIDRATSAAAALAAKLGWRSPRRGDAAVGALTGQAPAAKRVSIVPGHDPLTTKVQLGENQVFLSLDTTRRVADLFRLGPRRLSTPQAHAHLEALTKALIPVRSVRSSNDALSRAVDDLLERADLSLTDYRVALALLQLAGEEPAEERLRSKASHLYESDIYPGHYSAAASFYDPDPCYVVKGELVMQVLQDRALKARGEVD